MVDGEGGGEDQGVKLIQPNGNALGLRCLVEKGVLKGQVNILYVVSVSGNKDYFAPLVLGVFPCYLRFTKG